MRFRNGSIVATILDLLKKLLPLHTKARYQAFLKAFRDAHAEEITCSVVINDLTPKRIKFPNILRAYKELNDRPYGYVLPDDLLSDITMDILEEIPGISLWLQTIHKELDGLIFEANLPTRENVKISWIYMQPSAKGFIMIGRAELRLNEKEKICVEIKLAEVVGDKIHTGLQIPKFLTKDTMEFFVGQAIEQLKHLYLGTNHAEKME